MGKYNQVSLNANQNSLINNVLSSDFSRKILFAPIGSGKTRVVGEIAKQLIEIGSPRILIVTHSKLLIDRYIELFDGYDLKPKVTVLDVKKYREIDFQCETNNLWDNSIILTSLSSLKQVEIQELVWSLDWQLIIFDDVILKPSTSDSTFLPEFIRRTKTEKLLLIAIPGNQSNIERTLGPLFQGFSVTRWELDSPIIKIPLTYLVINYQRTEPELGFISQYNRILKYLNSVEYQQQILLSSLSSSLYVAEKTIRDIRNSIAHNSYEASVQSRDEDLAVISDEETSFLAPISLRDDFLPLNKRKHLLKLINKSISLFNQIDVDSKFEALRKGLQEFIDLNNRIWIYSYNQSTISYLYSSLKDYNLNIFQISNHDSIHEEEESMDSFLKDGGVLIAPFNKINGNLLDFDGLVLFDIPKNISLLTYILRYNTTYESKPRKVITLHDESKMIVSEEQRNQMVGELIRQISTN